MNSLTDISIEVVEQFTPELTPIVDRLSRQIGQNYEGISDDALAQIINSDMTHLVMAKDRETGEYIGMVTLVIYRIPYKTKAWIEDLVVYDSYRGKGIASLLMDKAISLAKEKHVTKLDLTSRPERESAHTLYAKFGFQKHETNVYRLVLSPKYE